MHWTEHGISMKYIDLSMILVQYEVHWTVYGISMKYTEPVYGIGMKYSKLSMV